MRTTNNEQRAPPAANFDRIARPYVWLEYLTLGRALERCRLRFLPQLADRTRALVLGDGDGRFLAALLRQNSALTANAVDSSGVMLELLRNRCRQNVPTSASRLQETPEGRPRTHHCEALSYLATPSDDILNLNCDLVVTHFFLDCLTQAEVEALVAAVRPRLAPGAIWLISEFRIPHGAMRPLARTAVRSLYLAFRILTGLRVDRLPDHASALKQAKFTRLAHASSLFGVLIAELWTLSPHAAQPPQL